MNLFQVQDPEDVKSLVASRVNASMSWLIFKICRVKILVSRLAKLVENVNFGHTTLLGESVPCSADATVSTSKNARVAITEAKPAQQVVLLCLIVSVLTFLSGA